MANSVFAQLGNIFGQQQSQTTGQLTQAAGGTGADRIAVGQANLANQQGLAAGQTASQLYNTALQSAQQTKGLQQNAGFGQEGLGTTIQNANLQGAGANLGVGNQQQQQQQNVLNSPYNLALQQFAYPFQTAQYLSGVTGSLAGALGGTTNGQSVTTPPAPSLISQIAGGAGLGLAAYNVFGGGGGKGSSPSYGGGSAAAGDAYGGSGANPLPGLTSADYGAGYASGGSVEGVGGLGSDPFGDLGGPSVVPNVTLRPTAAPRPMQMSSPAPQSGNNSMQAIGDAAKLAMMFMAGGGAVNPYSTGRGYADGGSPIDDRFANPDLGGMYADQKSIAPLLIAEGLKRQGISPPAPDASPAPPDQSNPWSQIADQGNGVPLGNTGGLPASASPLADPDNAVLPSEAEPDAGNAPSGLQQPLTMPQMPNAQLPYPDAQAPGNDTSRSLARNPWMALAQASLATMAGTSPYAGVNIGKGGQEGLKVLQEQRKEAREDFSANQRAQQLYQQAQQHLDQYNKVPLKDQQHLELERQKLATENWVPTGALDVNGNAVLFNKKTGEQKTAQGADGLSPTAASNYAWAKEHPDDPRAQGLLGDAERYLKTGTLPTNMGRGAQGAAEAKRIRTTAYQMAQERGIPPGDLPKNWQAFKGEQTAINRFMGVRGDTVRSLNVITDHAQTLGDLGAALKNGNIPLFNKIAQEWAQQTGNPVPTNFDMAKTIVGTELVKALGVAGAGTAEERAALGQSINRASSPEQISGILDTVVRPLLGGQLRGLQKQWNADTGLPESKFNDHLFPGTLKWLGSTGQPPTTTGGTQAPPPPPPAGSIAGTKGGKAVWKTPDGQYLPRAE
jgi:hypothetical protein